MALPTIALSFLVLTATLVKGQDDLGLSNGYTTFIVGNLTGGIVKSSGTLASLNSTLNQFDFLPSDRVAQLAFNGAHHIGDVTLRYRASNSGAWTSVDSASTRRPVSTLNSTGQDVVAAADMGPTLPSGLPVTITRNGSSTVMTSPYASTSPTIAIKA